MNIIAILGLLAASSTITAVGDLRLATISEIRAVAPGVAIPDLEILSSPPLLAPLQKVIVRRTTYHAETKQWQLQLRCVPQRACLPFIAVVRTTNQSLFTRTDAPHATGPLIHAGDRKEMSSTFGAVRLRQYVICLQAGRPGDSIRVRLPGVPRVLLATVTPDGSLTGGRLR